MELINQTPLPAELMVSELEGTRRRYGLLFAKATFRFDPNGDVALEEQDPVPLFAADEPHELGCLPPDLALRFDAAFEVIVLGAAYGRGGRAVPRRAVELSVGTVTRRLAVFGDRRWRTRAMGLAREIGDPEPFDRMPLTYERAFGGSADAYFDPKNAIRVEHSLNKRGRGFDAEKHAQDLAAGLRSPQGFPILRDYERTLPNLEHPEHLVARWQDAPEPYCWATIPADIGFRGIRPLRYFQRHGEPMPVADTNREILYRAHPDWVISLPPARARVQMEGLTPEGRAVFELPALRVLADYVLGERTGERELRPQLLVLLPEERRFYVVYRLSFNMETAPARERSFRLRLRDGWFSDETKEVAA